MIKDLLSIPQAAKRCDVSRVTLWKFVKSGEIRASCTPGGHYRILEKDLHAFMHERKIHPVANNQSHTQKILIVDDDAEIREILVTTLSNYQYETDVASDGFTAGIKVKEFNPGLVILDLIMPEMDGFAVCRQLKNNHSTSHIKILAITGYDNRENRDRIMASGADGYLRKPFQQMTLLQNIEILLKQNVDVKGHR